MSIFLEASVISLPKDEVPADRHSTLSQSKYILFSLYPSYIGHMSSKYNHNFVTKMLALIHLS